MNLLCLFKKNMKTLDVDNCKILILLLETKSSTYI